MCVSVCVCVWSKDTDKVLADNDRDSVEAWVASLHRQRQVGFPAVRRPYCTDLLCSLDSVADNATKLIQYRTRSLVIRTKFLKNTSEKS